MRVTCSGCGHRFKVPEKAGGRKVRCPECETPVAVPRHEPTEKGDDPRSKRRSGTAGKKRSAEREPAIPVKAILIGAAGTVALVLIASVVWIVTRGGDGPAEEGPVAGEPAMEGSPLTGGKVVFTTPLPGAPGPEARQPPPPIAPEQPLAAVALLPEASGGDAFGTGEWRGKPDPADEAPEPPPETALVHLRNEESPLLASLGGPFLIEHRGNFSGQAGRPGVVQENEYPLEVKDLRTGEVAGRFSWKVPVWPSPKHTVDARLSPDGRYVVGPDNQEGVPQTRKDGLLFVWEREKPEPVGQLKIPGPVLWIDFVADDKVAALTFDQAPVLQVWSVAAPDPELSILLPETEFKRPDSDVYTYQAPEAGDKTYLVDALIGALSPGGRYIALGGATAVHVISLDEGQTAGALPIPQKTLWPNQEPGPHTYQGLAFNDAGDELHVLLQAQRGWLLTWSLESSRLTSAAMLRDVSEFRGPPIPGPERGTVVIPDYQFSDGAVVQSLTAAQGSVFSTGAVVETRTGNVLSPIGWRPIRRNGDGVLAMTNLKANPDLPPPPWFDPNSEFLTEFDKQHLLETRIVKSAEFDRDTIRAQLATAATETVRPLPQPGDREGLVAVQPTPPASWTSPPGLPAPPEGLIGAYNVPNTRPLFGDTYVGFVNSYIPPEDPELVEQLRFKARSGDQQAAEELSAMVPSTRGVVWLRYDLRTGRPEAPVDLGSLGASETQSIDFARTPVAAAMTRDGARLALRDPSDMARVDIWDATDGLLLSILPYGPDIPVQWVGWSSGGRLLTVGDGRFTGWDVPAGKAAFEVEGGYRLPVCPARGGAWLAVSAGPHIDLLDAEIGACLGRCSVPGEELDPSRPTDITLTSDGGHLMHFGWRKTQDWDALGVVTAWDLATGTAQPTVSVPSAPSGVQRALDGRRVLAGGIFDLQTQVVYARYMLPTFTTTDYAPYPGGVLPGSPDGRMWAFGPDDADPNRSRVMLRPLDFPGYAGDATDLAFVFNRTTPLVVEVEMGEEGRSRAFGQNLLRSLQAQGFQIGEGGWTLRASCELGPSESFLTMKGTGGRVNVPQIVIHWKLYAPDGELAHTTSTTELPSGAQSYQGQEIVSQKGIEIEVEHTWEFDGDPHEVMVEELMKGLTTKGDVRLVYPIGKFQGKYQLLPSEMHAIFLPVP